MYRRLTAHQKKRIRSLPKVKKNGAEVFIAAAGGAAHLAGVVASATALPVIGVPIATNVMGGDGFPLSTVQMPPDSCCYCRHRGRKNAGILAAQILSVKDQSLRDRIRNYRQTMANGGQSKG